MCSKKDQSIQGSSYLLTSVSFTLDKYLLSQQHTLLPEESRDEETEPMLAILCLVLEKGSLSNLELMHQAKLSD